MNTNQICDTWVKDIQAYTNEANMGEKIFEVIQKKKSDKLEVIVNFDEKLINLFKETRNLSRISAVKLPFSVKFKADDAQ